MFVWTFDNFLDLCKHFISSQFQIFIMEFIEVIPNRVYCCAYIAETPDGRQIVWSVTPLLGISPVNC